MKRQKIYTQQMLARVLDFGETHLKLFPDTSAAADLIASLSTAVTRLGGHASFQVSGNGAIRTSAVSRKDARAALKMKLDMMDQTARALKLNQFYMPRNRTDAAYIAAGKSFAREASVIRDDFVKQGMPPDFIETLSAAVQDVQRAELDHTSSKGARSGSIAEFESTLKQALKDLRRFDALVLNTLADHPGLMAAWNIARRVGRASGGRPAAAAAAPPDASVPPS